jgi:hypothetical protein
MQHAEVTALYDLKKKKTTKQQLKQHFKVNLPADSTWSGLLS